MYQNLNAEGLGISGRQSELIELALTYGFHGIDIDMDAFVRQFHEHGIEHAGRFLTAANVKIGCFDLPVRWHEDDETYQQDLAQLDSYAEAVRALDARNCHTDVMTASDEKPYHENFEFHRQRLAEIAEKLQKHDIRLGIGFMAPAYYRDGKSQSFTSTPDALVTLLKTTVAENLGVTLDIWHWSLGGGTMSQVRELTVDQIVSVRISDVPAGVTAASITEEHRLMPGETGVAPCRELLEFLKEIDYSGPVTQYARSQSEGKATRDQTVDVASKSIKALLRPAPKIVDEASPDTRADEAGTETVVTS